MLQEDSNGETFEIIDKKTEELSIAESLSSMSSSASLLPSPSVSISSVPASTGNLLSNVQPPSALPNFITQAGATVPTVKPIPSIPAVPLIPQQAATLPTIQAVPLPGVQPSVASAVPIVAQKEPFYPTEFSAAIPPSKGIQHGVPVDPPFAASAQDAGGFMDWMRGAVSTGGILSKVAEKAKNSVDSMITTLDPQMREFIYTGGDVEILVASMQEMKVSAVREAFQSVFGKARVDGIEAKATNVAAQPVGFASGVKAAEERIQAVLSNPKVQSPLPVIAVEGFILEVGEDKWYDLCVITLNDPVKQINLTTFSQMTPVPAEIVALAQEDTPADYPLRWSGLAVTIGSLMASNLHVSHTEWHQALTGVSRRDIILSAAKTLANLYKNSSS